MADTDIISLKSIHTLRGYYLDHMLVKFEQQQQQQQQQQKTPKTHTHTNIQNFELFDKKCLTISNKMLTPFSKELKKTV